MFSEYIEFHKKKTICSFPDEKGGKDSRKEATCHGRGESREAETAREDGAEARRKK